MHISSSNAKHISKIFSSKSFKLSRKNKTVSFNKYLKKIKSKVSSSLTYGRAISLCKLSKV